MAWQEGSGWCELGGDGTSRTPLGHSLAPGCACAGLCILNWNKAPVLPCRSCAGWVSSVLAVADGSSAQRGKH